MSLFALSLRPPSDFFFFFWQKPQKSRKSKGAQGDQTKPDEKGAKTTNRYRRDNLHDFIKGGEKEP